MDIRYSANQKDFKRYTTEETRSEFLIEHLYQPDEVVSVYSHVDRVVTLGCMPVKETVSLDKGINVWECFGAKYFLERREIGIFNIGGPGSILVDGKEYKADFKDCLYITMGTKEVAFTSHNAAQPAKYFMVSSPAHKPCVTTFIPIDKAAKRKVGSKATCNERTICQFIHPDVLETCQLLMGLTALEEGSVWNTMPCHTHERRMEVYSYIGLADENVVFHMMGQPEQTRHVVMRAEQAIISPSWSIHSGCGTSSYIQIWAMAGENKEFDDMDAIPMSQLG